MELIIKFNEIWKLTSLSFIPDYFWEKNENFLGGTQSMLFDFNKHTVKEKDAYSFLQTETL